MNSTFTRVRPGQIDGPDSAGQRRPTTEIGVKGASGVCIDLVCA